MIYDTTSAGAFYPLWKKYKPILLQMMKNSEDGNSQQYQLSKHEFDDLKPVQNMVVPFKIVVKSGVKTKMDKKSLPAEGLLTVLKNSNSAIERLESHEYTFELDKEFVFHVSATAITPPAEN